MGGTIVHGCKSIFLIIIGEREMYTFINESNKGRIVSEDTREKIGKANKGKLKGAPRSEESKRKTSETMKGRTFSEEHRKNLSNAWELRKTKNSLEKELLCGK